MRQKGLLGAGTGRSCPRLRERQLGSSETLGSRVAFKNKLTGNASPNSSLTAIVWCGERESYPKLGIAETHWESRGSFFKKSKLSRNASPNSGLTAIVRWGERESCLQLGSAETHWELRGSLKKEQAQQKHFPLQRLDCSRATLFKPCHRHSATSLSPQAWRPPQVPVRLHRRPGVGRPKAPFRKPASERRPLQARTSSKGRST